MYAVIFLCKKYPKHFLHISEAYFNLTLHILLFTSLSCFDFRKCSSPRQNLPNSCMYEWLCCLALNAAPGVEHLPAAQKKPEPRASPLTAVILHGASKSPPPAVPLLPCSGADKQLNWCTFSEWAQTWTWWHLQKNSKDGEDFVWVLTCLCKGSKAIFAPCNPINQKIIKLELLTKTTAEINIPWLTYHCLFALNSKACFQLAGLFFNFGWFSFFTFLKLIFG